ncbi:hypothetical protein PTRA_b0087 [Pseudoalteromonas translucida KMM 520]|uniref:Uncharacterized protein n=1 Tax=Pseudoalteromonas translucida KMM 520 TaxID=1315283 RepID=A0A0U2VA70_9GAMM|nr:hypothetical protein PTRA_b0087 [Pseudoalteromonas translucida KMM 520]
MYAAHFKLNSVHNKVRTLRFEWVKRAGGCVKNKYSSTHLFPIFIRKIWQLITL